jgi:uncharacterized repeat protein (TIGR01451 family)
MFLILFLIPINANAEINTTNATNATDYPAQMNTTGLLKIITIPVDGEIYIDSVFVGSGLYYNTSFSTGIYRVSFGTVDGYENPKNQTVTLSANNQTNLIVQYTTTVITPPELTITKESSRSSIGVDETVDIIIKIKNSGNIKALNLSLNDSIPGCAAFVSGERSLSGDLGGGESRIIDYVVRPTGAGLCIFNPASVTFSDPAGNRFSKFSDEIKLGISSKPSREPHVVVEKGVDRSTALVDEGVVITLKLKNDGTSDAINVTLADDIPECAVISQGKNTWTGDLKQDEEKVLTYIVNVKKPGLCSFYAAKASYSDSNRNDYFKYSQPLNIYVKEKSVSQVLDPIVAPLIIIGTAIGSLLTIITVYKSLHGKIKKERK